MAIDNPENRILRSGPGPREIALVAEPLAARPPGAVLVRNLFSLIYPGRDLAIAARSQERAEWLMLGAIAIGIVDESGGPELGTGSVIYYEGPHARFAWLDPGAHRWTPIPEADPLLLPALVGAEAERGIESVTDDCGRPPADCIVAGQGMLGHLAAQYMQRIAGARVTVLENSPKRLEFSKYAGLTHRIDTHNLDWPRKLSGLHPEGVELLIDATGNPQPIAALLPFIKRGGQIHRLGSWRPEHYPEKTLAEIETRGIRVSGPVATAFDRTRARNWLELIRSGRIQTDRIVTHQVDPVEAVLAMKRLATGIRSWCGVVIDWRDHPAKPPFRP